MRTCRCETVVTFFHVSTLTPKAVILAELRMILLQAQKRASAKDLDFSAYNFTIDEGIKTGESHPPKNLRVQVALLRGAQVNSFSKNESSSPAGKKELAPRGRQITRE